MPCHRRPGLKRTSATCSCSSPSYSKSSLGSCRGCSAPARKKFPGAYITVGHAGDILPRRLWIEACLTLALSRVEGKHSLGYYLTMHSLLVFLYRIGHWLHTKNIKKLPGAIMVLGRFLYGSEIDPMANIGPNLVIVHTVGIVIGGKTVIGSNCILHQNITIGARNHIIDGQKEPIIGNNVTIYASALVLGPITVGDNAVIGAGSVVIKDVPPNATVVGNPARIINIQPHQ
jgi:serine acetyltransferase